MSESPESCLNKGPYYNHFVHLISFGSIWIVAALIGYYRYQNLAIIFLFAGISLFNPIYKTVRRALGLCPISSDDPLKTIITCMTIGVPIGIIIGILPFIENINAFFHVFGILFGTVFLLVAYLYKLIGYLILALVLISGELFLLFYYDNFTVGGFFAGIALVTCGIIIRIWGYFSPQIFKIAIPVKKVFSR